MESICEVKRCLIRTRRTLRWILDADIEVLVREGKIVLWQEEVRGCYNQIRGVEMVCKNRAGCGKCKESTS